MTITTTAAHGLVAGQVVTIAGVAEGEYNGTFTVAGVPSPTTFTYTLRMRTWPPRAGGRSPPASW